MKTSNEAERSIVGALDRILLDDRATWDVCENCPLITIDPLNYRDCGADRWRDCPSITAVIKSLLEADPGKVIPDYICGFCDHPFTEAWYCSRPDCPVCQVCCGTGRNPERGDCNDDDSSPDPAQGNRAHR